MSQACASFILRPLLPGEPPPTCFIHAFRSSSPDRGRWWQGARGAGLAGTCGRGSGVRPPHAPVFHRVLSRPLWLPRSSLHTDGRAQVGGPVPKPLGLIRAGALATSSVLSGGVGLAWGSVL